MQIGVGNDIEATSRFHLSNDAKFLTRVFLPEELTYCFSDDNSAQHLAARFAGKEAVIKAMSQFDERLSYRNVLIHREKTGRITASIVDRNMEKTYDIVISLSHTKELAIATAIVIVRP